MRTWFIKLINKNDCTCFFDSFKKWSWGECCREHDLAYMLRTDKDSKLEVDGKLFACVRKKTFWLWASIMYIGNFTFSWIAWYFMYNKKDK